MSLKDELKNELKKQDVEYVEEIDEEVDVTPPPAQRNGSVVWRETPREHISVFKNPGRWWRQNYLSWRFYVTIYAGLALGAALINIIALAAAAATRGIDANGHIELTVGTYKDVHRKSLFAHWGISGISTYLLSASAYVMYCLTPPTREEIDKAHSKGQWLDIGAMSFRNIMRVSRKRIFLFMCLGFTSPILQLFYNSVLFMTYPANEYVAVVAHESFRFRPLISIDLSPNLTETVRLSEIYSPLIRHLHNESFHQGLEILNNAECIEAYGSSLLMNRKNLVLITEDDPQIPADVFHVFNAPLVTEDRQGREQYSWMCDHSIANSGQCLFHIQDLKQNAVNWTLPNGSRVKYCLSEPTEELCKLSFSVTLLTIVSVISVFKAIMMLAVAFWVPETPIMTTGDAITSFMNRPDPYTENMCMASKRLMADNANQWPKWPTPYSGQREMWGTSIKARIRSLALFMLLALSASAMLFATLNEAVSFKQIIFLGLGRINRDFFIGWAWKSASMLRSIVVANLGHAIFGTLYILYNNVFYCMIFAGEWSRYALHRKGLRVSEAPRGAQRTVYFFLMPYKLAFPIMGFSVAIHTLISQTAFLVNVEAYGSGADMMSLTPGDAGALLRSARQPQWDFNTTGFSPLGNIGLLLVGLCMVGFMLAFGRRRFMSGMPVTSTCSAAISAACHPSKDEDPNPHLLPLSWGVVPGDEEGGAGHCTFSSKEVTMPEEGRLYF